MGDRYLKNRVKKIFNNCEKNPDLIIIKNGTEPFIDDNFFYATGLKKGLFEGAVAVLFEDGNIELIISQLEEESAKKADANINTYRDGEEFNEIFKRITRSVKTIGLNFDKITYRDYNGIKQKYPNIDFLDTSDALSRSRRTKDEIEINLIKEAAKIADKAMEKVPDILNEDMHEYELAAEINYLMQKYGADKVAFDTISSFGKNTAEPHYSHGNVKLVKGDFVLCDFGACFERYNSDMTRTFVFGRATETQKDMHKTVLQAQKIGFKKIQEGFAAHEVHDAVEAFINSTKFKGRFIHSTGHSLGLAVHDGSVNFSQSCNVKLQENMILTVEPGVYVPGFGGVRIEDDILIKSDGIEILTKTPRELIEI